MTYNKDKRREQKRKWRKKYPEKVKAQRIFYIISIGLGVAYIFFIFQIEADLFNVRYTSMMIINLLEWLYFSVGLIVGTLVTLIAVKK